MIYIFFIILLVTNIIKSLKKEKSSKNIKKIITTGSIYIFCFLIFMFSSVTIIANHYKPQIQTKTEKIYIHQLPNGKYYRWNFSKLNTSGYITFYTYKENTYTEEEFWTNKGIRLGHADNNPYIILKKKIPPEIPNYIKFIFFIDTPNPEIEYISIFTQDIKE